MSRIFASHAGDYRKAGFWSRPVTPGTKAPSIKNWTAPDTEIAQVELDGWGPRYADYGLGILMGSPFPDGSKLVGIDIDRDDYVRLTQALLDNPVCGRVGARGVVFFARMRGDAKYRQFSTRDENGDIIKIGELLGEKRFCVLPPTIHPSTNQPYRWLGKTLLEIDFSELPVIDA